MAKKGKRYSDAEKQKVLDVVNKVNTEKGRGGVAAAARQFKISPLTVTAWTKKSGVKTPTKAKAAPKTKVKTTGKRGRQAAPVNKAGTTKAKTSTKGGNPFIALAELHDEIAATEQVLANLQAEYAKLKKSI